MTTISPKDRDIISKLIGSTCKILFLTQVKLYKREIQLDQTLQFSGILCFVKDYQKDCLYFRLFSLNTKRILWSYRITSTADYNNPISFVHTISTATVRIALHFQDEIEADFLFQVVKRSVIHTKSEDPTLEDSEIEEEHNLDEPEPSINEKSRTSYIFGRLGSFVNFNNYNKENGDVISKKYSSHEHLPTSKKWKFPRRSSNEEDKRTSHNSESYKEFKKYISKRIQIIQRKLHNVISHDKKSNENSRNQQERTADSVDFNGVDFRRRLSNDNDESSFPINKKNDDSDPNFLPRFHIKGFKTNNSNINDKYREENISVRKDESLWTDSDEEFDGLGKCNGGFRSVISRNFQTVQRKWHKNVASNKLKNDNFGNCEDSQIPKYDDNIESINTTLRLAFPVENNVESFSQNEPITLNNPGRSRGFEESFTTSPTILIKDDIASARNYNHLSHAGWESFDSSSDNFEPFPTFTKENSFSKNTARNIKMQSKSMENLSSNYYVENPEVNKGFRGFVSKKLENLQKKLGNSERCRQFENIDKLSGPNFSALNLRPSVNDIIEKDDIDNRININTKTSTKNPINTSRTNSKSTNSLIDELTKNDIGFATNPRHLSHVGWDNNEKTFVTRINNYELSENGNSSLKLGTVTKSSEESNEFQWISDWISLKKDDEPKGASIYSKPPIKNSTQYSDIIEIEYAKPCNGVPKVSTKFKLKKTGKAPEGKLTKADIGNATNLRHVAHVGWDSKEKAFVSKVFN